MYHHPSGWAVSLRSGLVLIPVPARPRPRDHFQIEPVTPKPSFSFILVGLPGTSATMKTYQNTPEKNRGASSSSKRMARDAVRNQKRPCRRSAAFHGSKRSQKRGPRSVEAFQSVPLVAARTTAGATTVLSLADCEPTYSVPCPIASDRGLMATGRLAPPVSTCLHFPVPSLCAAPFAHLTPDDAPRRCDALRLQFTANHARCALAESRDA